MAVDTLPLTRRSLTRLVLIGPLGVAGVLSGCASNERADDGPQTFPWSPDPLIAEIVSLKAPERDDGPMLLALKLTNTQRKELVIESLRLQLDLNNRRVAEAQLPANAKVAPGKTWEASLPLRVTADWPTRQMLGWMDTQARGALPFRLRGDFKPNLAISLVGLQTRFESTGLIQIQR